MTSSIVVLAFVASMPSGAAPSQMPPTVAEVVAAIGAARAGLDRFELEAEVVWSGDKTVRVRVARDGDAARWSRSVSAALGAGQAFDAMRRDGVGVMVRPEPAAGVGDGVGAATISDPSWLLHPKAEVPGHEYLHYLRWNPIDAGVDATFGLAAELSGGGFQVRAESELVHGVDCWVLDRVAPDGQITVSYWIAPSRSWMPARQVLRGGGDSVQIVEVTAWHELEGGHHIPRTGVTTHLDGAGSSSMALVVREDGAVAASSVPNLPMAATDIIPAGSTVWDARAARVQACADARERSPNAR